MNEQKDRERIHHALDSALSGLQENPYLLQRISIRLEEGETNMKRNKISIKAVFAVIAILSMFTAAIAAGMNGYVNWLGEFTPEETFPQVLPTEAPEEMDDQQKLFDLTQQILDSAGDRELVAVWDETGGSSISPMIRTDSLQQMKELLKTAEHLPQAQFIPEGYEFAEGYVEYACEADGVYEHLSHEELSEGLTVDRYRIPEEDAFAESYSMIFRESDEDYHYMFIYVSLEQSGDPADFAFGLNEDQTAQAVKVPGMDNALAITADHMCSLHMRQTLPIPMEYRYFDGMDVDSTEEYSEIHIDISAPLLDTETLINMFAQ